jgi:hypothetical protein
VGHFIAPNRKPVYSLWFKITPSAFLHDQVEAQANLGRLLTNVVPHALHDNHRGSLQLAEDIAIRNALVTGREMTTL